MYQEKAAKKDTSQQTTGDARKTTSSAAISLPAPDRMIMAQDIINNSPVTIQQKSKVVQFGRGRDRGTVYTIPPATVPTLGGHNTTMKMTDYPGSIIIYSMVDPINNKNEIHVHTNGTGGHGWTTIKNNGEQGNGIVVTNDAQYQSLIQAVLSKHPNVQ
jgi:hypothetical protein